MYFGILLPVYRITKLIYKLKVNIYINRFKYIQIYCSKAIYYFGNYNNNKS